MPFYATLAQDRIIALALGEDVETNQKYLSSHELRPARVLSAQDVGVSAVGTPTLILVDGRGVVQNAWRGKLPAHLEREVRTQLQELDR